MAEGKVQLRSDGLKVWVEAMRQSITRARDGVSLLESEEKRLSDIWEGAAEKKWEEGFWRELESAKQCIGDMERKVTETVEAAQALAQMERNLAGEAARV